MFTSEPSKSCSECQQDVRKQYFSMSICQYVEMSECQYFRMQIFSLGIKRKVVQNVKTMSENIMLVCQHVDMSVCQYVRKLLFSLGMKMEVVQNIILFKMA